MILHFLAQIHKSGAVAPDPHDDILVVFRILLGLPQQLGIIDGDVQLVESAVQGAEDKGVQNGPLAMDWTMAVGPLTALPGVGQ